MNAIDRTINQGRASLCELLKELVRIPTVNPPGAHYAEMVDVLEEKCRVLGMETQVVRVPEAVARAIVPHAETHPRLSLIARWDVGAEETVHFNAHFDVVPAAGDWSMDPFEPKVVGDWLYGRGADDMKDSIAALLFALAALREHGVRPAFNIECSFVCDEEIGGELGAGYLVKRGLLKADYAVVCEGGERQSVGLGHNGALWLEVTLHGKAAHAATGKGINAFEKMVRLVVSGLLPLKQRLRSPERMFTIPGGYETYPSINLGGEFGGTEADKVNIVPGRARFTIDRRIVPSESLASADRELRAAIEEARAADAGLKADIRSILRIDPCVVDSGHPFPQALARAVRRVRRRPVGFRTGVGFTDLHFFVEDGGMPGAGFGPAGSGAHGADERVRIRDVMQVAKIYATFMSTPLARMGAAARLGGKPN